MRSLLVALFLVGCPKGPAAPEASWSDVPTLPSPSAGTYARAPATPSDPPMAALMEGHRWDASLSGAATAIALLRGSSPPSWRVRHLAWQAGYPYPIETLSIWHTEAGAPPPADLLAWLDRQPAGADLGVVRSRTADGDTWVALTGRSRANIGVQPRQLPVGATFTLPPLPGATVQVVDSHGDIAEGNLEIPQTFTADLPGEWLVKVADAEGLIARFPIYVGQTPPTHPVVGAAVDGTPDEQVRALLAEIRATHGLAPYTSDLLFEAAARRDLEGSDTPRDVLARRLGWDADTFARWDVRAASVAEALDRVIWEPGSRPGLLAPEASYGVAASQDDAGVHVIVLVGFP